jgi:hypothetical protein
MAKQGCSLSGTEIQTIISLLSATDTAIPDIAERMGCSRGAIVSINRKFQVRNYSGRRSSWTVETERGVVTAVRL